MKKCSQCQTELSMENFCCNKGSKDGLNHRCRKCASENSVRYRAENLERLIQYARNYEEVNKEERLLKRREKYAKEKAENES